MLQPPATDNRFNNASFASRRREFNQEAYPFRIQPGNECLPGPRVFNTFPGTVPSYPSFVSPSPHHPAIQESGDMAVNLGVQAQGHVPADGQGKPVTLVHRVKVRHLVKYIYT